MLGIIKFKGCRRCGGDLFLERDTDGSYVSCLQCGAVYNRHTREKSRKLSARLRSGRYVNV
jgi:DNA-directed RNA polymerase subunit M/transcription elongation factor TFIIS